MQNIPPPSNPGQRPPMPRPGVGSMMPPVQSGMPEAPPVEEEPKLPPQALKDLHIDELLHIVVDKNASDLHICSNSPPVIREDGKLKRLNYEEFTPQEIQRMMYDII